MKNLCLITIALLFTVATHAQTTNVQFQVNMNYKIALGTFNPATQTVDIAGTFNNWGAPTTALSDSDADGIYTVSIALPIGTGIQFKTRINALWNGTEEFAGGGPNRMYTVAANGIVAYWYNDQVSPDVLSVAFTSSANVVQPGQSVQFTDQSTGNPVTWEWSFPGGSPAVSSDQNPLVAYPDVGVYSVSLTVTNAASQSLTETHANLIRVDAMQTYWWNDRVFYEVFLRSFKDSNGNGIGDIQGLISKLDYLNDGNPATTTDLGVTAIWLMPVQQSPSYHGYDTTDYMTVEADYGTNADFAALTAAAHARGIKVIIDMVMNHTSNLDPWFIASQTASNPKRDWYIWENTNPGTPGPFAGDPWHALNSDYFYGCFNAGMPDLNFYKQEVRDEFDNITEYWLNTMGADGFRLDAANVLMENATVAINAPETLAYWQQFRAHYKSVKPDAYSVGEVIEPTSVIQQYVNNEGLDNCFEFNVASATINALNNGNATGLSTALNEASIAFPFLQYGTFISNHDQVRVMSQFSSDVNKAKAAATMLLTLPGVPYIYYGEELGMTSGTLDPTKRTPMQWTGSANAGFSSTTPWQAPNADFTTKNVAAQQASSTSLWTTYRNLITIRNNEAALTKGNYRPIISSSTAALSYIRQYQGQNVLVVVNVGATALANVTLSLSTGGITPGNYTMTSLIGGSSLNVTIGADGGFSVLEIAALPIRGTLIYKLQETLGSTTFSGLTVAVYPVPSHDYIYAQLSNEMNGEVTYNISDMAGRKLSAGKFNYVKGENYRIAIDQLPAGIYFIKFSSGAKSSVVKFLVE